MRSRTVDWGISGDFRSGRPGLGGGRFWGCDVGGAFEQSAFVEDGAGADQGHQMWGVNGPPAGLGGVDQLVGHGNPGRTRSRTLGDLGAQPNCGKRRLDIGLVVRR